MEFSSSRGGGSWLAGGLPGRWVPPARHEGLFLGPKITQIGHFWGSGADFFSFLVILVGRPQEKGIFNPPPPLAQVSPGGDPRGG